MNELLALAPAFLRIISAALGTGTLSKPVAVQALSKTLDIGAALIERGTEGTDALRALTEHVGKMVSENASRSPEAWAQVVPQADWDTLEGLHNDAKAVIAAFDPVAQRAQNTGTAGTTARQDAPPSAPATPAADPQATTPVAVAVAVSQNEQDPNAAPQTGNPPDGSGA